MGIKDYFVLCLVLGLTLTIGIKSLSDLIKGKSDSVVMVLDVIIATATIATFFGVLLSLFVSIK